MTPQKEKFEIVNGPSGLSLRLALIDDHPRKVSFTFRNPPRNVPKVGRTLITRLGRTETGVWQFDGIIPGTSICVSGIYCPKTRSGVISLSEDWRLK